MTYDEQLDLLASQGLSIPDRAHAAEVLSDVGYYELVNGYKALYKQAGSSYYRKGTTFDDLLALYKFDENLRQLCFKYLLRIEIRMRSLLSYAFCDQYGVRQSAYLNPDNYTDDSEKRRTVQRVIGELRSATNDDRAPYVRYQRTEYGNVPLWVLFKALSLGTVVRFYAASANEIRRKTAAAFEDLYPDTLERMLDVMLDFRNACAHNNILYTCKSDAAIPPMPCLRSLYREQRFEFCGNDLFALVIIFRFLLKTEDFIKFKAGLRRIFDHYLGQCAVVTEAELLSVMGFPFDWENL